MSRHLSRSIRKSQGKAVDDAKRVLEGGAPKRQTIADEDLMVVGGNKIDLSADMAANVEDDDNPDSFLPRFVCTDGKVYDLDAEDAEGNRGGEEMSLRDTIEIDGRVLTIGDFEGHIVIVIEMYETFLKACHHGWPSEFRRKDGTFDIIDYVQDIHSKRMIQPKYDPDGTVVYYVDWSDPSVTFEHWMQWAAATTRWRLKAQLQERYEREIDIRTRQTMKTSQDVAGETLVAIEKFLALPERKRLTAV